MPDGLDAYGYKISSQKHLVLQAMGAFGPKREWRSAWDLAAAIHSVHGGDVIRFLKRDGWEFYEETRTSPVTGKRYKAWLLGLPPLIPLLADLERDHASQRQCDHERQVAEEEAAEIGRLF